MPSTPKWTTCCSTPGRVSATTPMSGWPSFPGTATRPSAPAPIWLRTWTAGWAAAPIWAARFSAGVSPEALPAGCITRASRSSRPCTAWSSGAASNSRWPAIFAWPAPDAQFGFYHMRRGMHFADGGIVRLVNTCGVGIAMELELMGEAITAERARECHLVNRVVPRAELMTTTEDIAAKILKNPRTAVESAKETILEVVGRPWTTSSGSSACTATRSWVIRRSANAGTRSWPTATARDRRRPWRRPLLLHPSRRPGSG